MAQPSVRSLSNSDRTDSPAMWEPRLTPVDKKTAASAKSKEYQVRRESSDQYKSSIEKINRAQDRDIERVLRNY
jgi:hypothetical protein